MKGRPCTAVLRRGCPDRHPFEIDGLARWKVDDPLEAFPPKQTPGTWTTDHQRLRGEGAKARAIEMVEVVMGEQDCIDSFGPLDAPYPLVSTKMEHPVAKDRVGKQLRIGLL